MKALTIYQPWASLIVAGAKRYEFRGWDFSKRFPSLVNEVIVIHAAARAIMKREVEDILDRLSAGETGLDIAIARPIVERALAEPHVFSRAAGVGTARILRPRPVTELFRGVIDSDRLDHTKFGWPLIEIKRWEPPVPCRGHQSFWEWPEKASAA
jgi:hypothetical protein